MATCGDEDDPAAATNPGARRDRKRRRRTLAAVVVVAHVLGILSSIDAVWTTRTPQGTIAWVALLNTVPYVAVPAYWILGRSRFHGYVTARRGDLEEIAGVGDSVARATTSFRPPPTEIAPAGLAAERLAELPILRGNTVKLLIDGEATFDDILEGIASAKDYVLFQFFIVHDDEIGRRAKDALVERARGGVRVYFLYDEVGSHDLPRSYLDELRAAGVEAYDFHTRKGPRNRFQINFRNHRKIVVVDGRVAWVGGHNVGDEYLGRDPKFGHWRDTHVRIEGPAALGAQLSFAEDWHWATDRQLDLSWMPVPAADADLPVLIIPTGPADEFETAGLMFVHALDSARERIWIASPYFVPDLAVEKALQLAALRGVDVRVLIPEKPDHLMVYLAAYAYLDDAERAGVKFYRYEDGFLHQKVMLIDDVAATVGTANFDNRSFRLNFEITALVGGTTFAAEVEKMLEADFAASRRTYAKELDEKSFWFKLGVRLARLTAPIQ